MKESKFEHSGSIAVLYFDVNNFKTINDTLGHEAGDHLIVQASQSIQRITDEHVYAFRMGGDEFLVIAPDISENQAENLKQVWENTLDEINLSEKGHPITIACGMEYAVKPYIFDDIIANADDKMYQNKKEMKRNHGLSERRQL